MLTIAGGIILALFILALLPLIVRLIGFALAAVAAVLFAAAFVYGFVGTLYLAWNWQTTVADPVFWVAIALAVGAWLILVFHLKPDWLTPPD